MPIEDFRSLTLDTIGHAYEVVQTVDLVELEDGRETLPT